MTLKGVKIRHNNKDYAVFRTTYDGVDIPVVTDWSDFKVLDKLDKNWRCTGSGFVSCSHTKDGCTAEIFVHEIVMGLANDNDKKVQKGGTAILHINKIGLDNRRDNLRYNLKDATKRNQKKKKRTITLPASSGIKAQEIPTYVWYLKPNGSHGARFCVEVGDVKWKTTSSKKLSLRYKLEEAKEFLRNLKKSQPDIFSEHCMNGEYTEEGKTLLKSFHQIVQKAGYSVTLNTTENQTDQYLKQGSIKKITEKKLLGKQEIHPESKIKKRRVISNLPAKCGISINDIPAHCYYRPCYKNRGDYFVVENHPNQKKRTWQTSSSKSLTIQDKFKQLKEYLKQLNKKK